ncbi:Diaminopimelate epimerase-like protein [Aspergillus welwitschiae]|uniref:trans-L-3-hydroxyproline dehydratase n=1 Tax=Aspergillus welwitschiae TaxID=1341132 RepID=A0A3F3PJB3_9EURO|nr:Diaminopimelate epimerase-like protein [Aspergillus welwitschiae]RDH26967.1 Diaminopimelate epimerase-like protein [Aspergillus welwitschiae]
MWNEIRGNARHKLSSLGGKTLLDKRDQAQTEYDHIRKRLMLEPRGHDDMYGAIIVPETELVESGHAHIGVLFTHNGGFSTMCGHATIALERSLVDTHDLSVFPRRGDLVFDDVEKTVALNIHAPCGLARVTVPATEDGRKSDPSRPVAFLSTPAYAAGIDLDIEIPAEIRWPELGERETIKVDISYGGTFYVLVNAEELGFEKGLESVDLISVAHAVGKLKPYLSRHRDVVEALQNAEDRRLSFLYSVMVTDQAVGSRPDGVDGAETGLCLFADNQIDRSPTGSCVTARMALAHAKGVRPVDQRWAYNSLVSNFFDNGAFVATIVDKDATVRKHDGGVQSAVVVRVEGFAYYTGSCNFIVEGGDLTSEAAFRMKTVAKGKSA